MDQTQPPATLQSVIGAIRGKVSYLRAETSLGDGDGWLLCDALCGGGAVLAGLIRETGEGRGTREADVAASLFAQAYAFRIAAIPVAAHALGLPVPEVRPHATAISIARHRPSSIALLSPEVHRYEHDDLARMILEDHLAPFHAAIRGQITIGERLLWGNAASSIARVFRAIESAGGVEAARVRERADGFFAAARPWLGGLGRFETVVAGGRDGWFWTRTSCCLWYQASGGSMCDDCSLLDPGELAETRRAEVAAAAGADR